MFLIPNWWISSEVLAHLTKSQLPQMSKTWSCVKKRAFLLYCEDLYPWLSTILNNNIWHGGAFNIFILGEEQMVRILSLLKKMGHFQCFLCIKFAQTYAKLRGTTNVCLNNSFIWFSLPSQFWINQGRWENKVNFLGLSFSLDIVRQLLYWWKKRRLSI